MKNIVILGSTGSIGESALKVVESLPSHFRVAGIAVQRNYRKALKQAERFDVKHVAVADIEQAKRCSADAPKGITVHAGSSGVNELAVLKGSDMVLCALVGMAGLKPVLTAVRKGLDVALATKEVLVAAGGIVTEACGKHGARLLPVDSEHSAIFQCLEGTRKMTDDRRLMTGIRRIILTASGGPFANQKKVDFNKVTVGEALNHPRWNMGKKVTVDSATLMNKGLEIMEAHWLFGLPVDKISVVIHPESIIHSMVEFIDGSVMAQMSVPDMRFAIQYALTYPERVEGNLPELNLVRLGALHFQEPDERRFPCLALARKAAGCGGTMPAVLNAANEVAVQNFLDGKTAFSGIWRIVESVMKKHKAIHVPNLDQIIESDKWARKAAVDELAK